ncbi:MAG: HIT domain-containing protein [Candidatus Dormibacterales bacterium]
MEHLFAPWRMEYVGAEPEPGCLFCRVLAAPATEDRRHLVVWRPPGAIVLLNRFPYNSGHVLVAAAAHLASPAEMDDVQALALMRALAASLRTLEKEMAPQGFNVGANLGRTAGAGIPDHFHLHVVPRWDGDTNFMPVLAEAKVVNEHLERTWERLSAAFRE